LFESCSLIEGNEILGNVLGLGEAQADLLCDFEQELVSVLAHLLNQSHLL
jgi:hypothetical protein